MSGNGNGRRRFGEFELSDGKLFRGGQPVRIQPQPLRVLEVLISRPGEIVSRDELHAHIWGDATFVEFDQGLNYCIRQIRQALCDNAANPTYIETLPKQGYRLIAPVTPNAAEVEAASPEKETAEPVVTEQPAGLSPASALPPAPSRFRFRLFVAAGICGVLAILCALVYRSFRVHPAPITYTQLTDFTDSATAPALSPDGRMVAFIRGSSSFFTADQTYVKVLPDGESKRLTNDGRLKYSLAFSPDGTQIAYTVLAPPTWATYTVSVLGGESHLFLNNAAGLTWLGPHRLLFSQIRSGLHMGIVSGTLTLENVRDLYFPPHERAMAHDSYASPDRKSALVVEMNEEGGWAPCRLIFLDGRSQVRQVGPNGSCTSAGWSPNASWMYFTAEVDGQSHLWRQRFPNGDPEQITFGPTEEEGVAVEPNGRSVITSMGVHESAIWIHDPHGDRSLSSEGEVLNRGSPPSFSPDDKVLYYLLRRQSAGSGSELWRLLVDSGESEAVFPGVSMFAYDVSPDNKQVVYATDTPDGKSQLWLAPLDRSSRAKRIGSSGRQPHFGPRGKILFQMAEKNSNYLEQMNQDGSGIAKVVPYSISEIQGISPDRRWVMAIVPVPVGKGVAPMAIPTGGGPPRRVCTSYCVPSCSPNGRFLIIPVQAPSRTSPGRSLAIPVGPEEELPELPPEGIPPLADTSVAPGSQSIARAGLVPGNDPSHFAYVNTTVHRNLYRISLP